MKNCHYTSFCVSANTNGS